MNDWHTVLIVNTLFVICCGFASLNVEGLMLMLTQLFDIIMRFEFKRSMSCDIVSVCCSMFTIPETILTHETSCKS